MRLFNFQNPERNPQLDDRVFDGAPQPLCTMENAIYLPKANVLYDEHGEQIRETQLIRGWGASAGENISKGPDRISPSTVTKNFSDPVILAHTIGFPQWGHFLLEGLSRLWVVDGHPELERLPFLHFRFEIGSGPWRWVRWIFERASLSQDRLLHFDEPVRLREVIIPAPSLVLALKCHSVHARFPLAAARGSLAKVRAVRTSQPVYLSRRMLPDATRKIRGEENIEKLLEKNGVRVVHPQHLTLDEQVSLFNAHETFIGCDGSAFHNLLFAGSGKKVVMLSGKYVPDDFRLIEALKKLDSCYVNCLSTASDDPAQYARLKDQVMDVGVAREALVRLGLVSGGHPLGRPAERVGERFKSSALDTLFTIKKGAFSSSLPQAVDNALSIAQFMGAKSSIIKYIGLRPGKTRKALSLRPSGARLGNGSNSGVFEWTDALIQCHSQIHEHVSAADAANLGSARTPVSSSSLVTGGFDLVWAGHRVLEGGGMHKSLKEISRLLTQGGFLAGVARPFESTSLESPMDYFSRFAELLELNGFHLTHIASGGDIVTSSLNKLFDLPSVGPEKSTASGQTRTRFAIVEALVRSGCSLREVESIMLQLCERFRFIAVKETPCLRT